MTKRRWQDAKSFRKNPGGTKTFIQKYEKRLVGYFSEAEPRYQAALEQSRQLESPALQPPIIDLTSFAGRVYEISTSILRRASKDTMDTSAEAYNRGSEFANQNVRQIGIVAGLPAGAGQLPADHRVIDAIQSRNLAGLKGITDDMSKEIIRVVSDGIQQGDGIDKIRRAITSRVDSIGKVRAQAIARTEVMNAWNTGAVTRFRQYGVEKVEWVTGTDEKVCDECAPLDGKQWPIGDAPEIPLHVNCRCVLIAVPAELPEEEAESALEAGEPGIKYHLGKKEPIHSEDGDIWIQPDTPEIRMEDET